MFVGRTVTLERQQPLAGPGSKESISEFDRRTWLLRGGATVAVVIGAEVIIGLGLALAGARITVAAARASRRIGQFTARAIETMAEMVQLLRRMVGQERTLSHPDAFPVHNEAP